MNSLEEKFIRENAHLLKDVQVAAALSRLTGRHVSIDMVQKARTRLGIKKSTGNGVCRVIKPKKTKPD